MHVLGTYTRNIQPYLSIVSYLFLILVCFFEKSILFYILSGIIFPFIFFLSQNNHCVCMLVAAPTRFECTKCGLTYRSEARLKHHEISECLESVLSKHECLSCGRRFMYKHSLVKHEQNLVCVRRIIQGVSVEFL